MMRKTKDYLFFYTAKDIFTNFYPVRFQHEGKWFHSSEQAVMYRKAVFFGGEGIANQILAARTPDEAKRLGRSRDIAFDEQKWVENRERIYQEVLMDKFSLPVTKKALLETENRILAEASPSDRVWGVGLSETDPRILYPNQWKGLNLLGKVLMEVRKELS